MSIHKDSIFKCCLGVYLFFSSTNLLAIQDPWEDVNINGQTILHQAVITGSVDSVKKIVRIYGDESFFINVVDNFGLTAFDYIQTVYTDEQYQDFGVEIEDALWEVGGRPAGSVK